MEGHGTNTGFDDGIDDRGKPALAPMLDGCQRVCRNLESGKPMFEGVDSESLNEMICQAQVELFERDTNGVASMERPDLDALNKTLLGHLCPIPDMPF